MALEGSNCHNGQSSSRTNGKHARERAEMPKREGSLQFKTCRSETVDTSDRSSVSCARMQTNPWPVVAEQMDRAIRTRLLPTGLWGSV